MTDHPTLTAAADRARARKGKAAAPALPAVLDPHGSLDVDALRVLAPQLRTSLIHALRRAATELRGERGAVVVPEDTYDLVRRLTAAQEVLTQWSQVFAEAAKEAAALIEEEALAAVGGLPGAEDVPTGSLFVPDGETQRIAVRPDWKAGESTWDVDTLKAWLAEDTVTEQGLGAATDRPVFTAQEAMSLVRDGMDRLTALGKFTPGAKPIEELRRKLAGQQRDADAAVIRQVRQVGDRKYQGVKITREEQP